MFGIGALRQRLFLQQENAVADTGGGKALGWTTIATVWANIEPINGRETVQAEKLTASTQFKIKMRYDSSINASMRFLWGNRVFNIRSIRNVNEQNRMFEIIAEEGVAT